MFCLPIKYALSVRTANPACFHSLQRVRLAPSSGGVTGIVTDRHSVGSRMLLANSYVDELVEADARDAIGTFEAVTAATSGKLPTFVVNCVNVAGTEMASILSC
jgi:L-erythro-3,5-diaminohexanoate dehydrogenase